MLRNKNVTLAKKDIATFRTTARNSLISEFRAVFARTSHSLHKPRPYAVFTAWEAVRGTDMSFSSFGTNPIATRFLAVHFFAKKSHFLTSLKNVAVL